MWTTTPLWSSQGPWDGPVATVVGRIAAAATTSRATVDVANITSADWSHAVGTYGEIVQGLDDIAQCIRIILGTPQGSDPHRPTFGCDAWRYLDYPESQSLPHIIRACTDAIAAWEPRATVSKITASYDLAHVTLTIIWSASLGSADQSTQVRYSLTTVQ